MSRLIDRPGAQETVVCTVDRVVLSSLLRELASYVTEDDPEEGRAYRGLALEVESGERGSLTVGEWRDMPR